MKALVRKLLFLMVIAFGYGLVPAASFEPVAKANLVDDVTTGKAQAQKFGMGAVTIAVILGVVATVVCLIFPPTRRFGFAVGSGMVMLIVLVMISKGTSIGDVLGDLIGSDNPVDIFTNK